MKVYAKIATTALGLVMASSLSFAQNRLDPVPEAPRPEAGETGGLSRQAGVGGDIAYARAGVLELGGSGSFLFADDAKTLILAPSIGYFIADNWQLSGILKWNWNKADGADGSHIFQALVEPSFHMPFTNTQFGFIGVGAGLAKATGDDLGFAIAPRVGYKLLIGRSGMLTADISNTFYTEEVEQAGNVTSFSITNQVAVGLGYTVLW